MASVSKELRASFILPDEIVLEILSKVMDLRTLCNCKSVSRRFYYIVCEVDTISFNAPSSWKTNDSKFRKHVYSLAVLKRPVSNRGRDHRKVDGLIYSMTKFTRLKSLYIELPFSSFKGLPFLKWKIFIAGNRILSFVFVSPTSIYDTIQGSSYQDHEKKEPYLKNYFNSDIAEKCMDDAFVRYMMLFVFARECPFLEKISITDSCKTGRVSLTGAKLSEVRTSSFEASPPKVENFPLKVRCHTGLLNLQVSGFVMKGVTIYLYEDRLHLYRYDRFIKIDDEDDKEEAAYSEAVRRFLSDIRRV